MDQLAIQPLRLAGAACPREFSRVVPPSFDRAGSVARGVDPFERRGECVDAGGLNELRVITGNFNERRTLGLQAKVRM